ncbi:hypothetical protein I302_107892 [Kwoniella bestiolae CBS 10118]|uniref:Alpha/beta hydrolase fold-3 domain-containing protein n=1 Tax=Kwoniella bestiolae CBS 10118 TaxID=1296100 RepID=A0A1B9FX95_9TREE|nr:hypothetical protein I302_06366 [Kwoniella bestiolae CBS 10118]OCF23385.1 hypothetical protein I302_06366 [Kwoniella bestiolae CBS 10118]
MQIETCPISQRTWLMHTLQTFIRPFKPSLVKPPSNLEKKLEWSKTGSPRLSIPRPVKRKCVVTERLVEDVWLYDLDHKSSTPKKNGRILYFCGGGFQAPPSSQHWSFVVELSRRLPHLHLTIISYPLAPRTTASTAIPALLKVYHEISSQSQRASEDLHMCGDSSGGNIALTLTLHALSTKSEVTPKSIMLISPVVDCSNSNPDMKEVNTVDPVLSTGYTGDVAIKWRGDVSPSDPTISPVEGELSLLQDRNVMVNGIIGTWDVLAPDTIRLMDRLKEIGVEGKWWVGEGQMHCFPLAWRYGLSDSVKAKDWIIDVLKQSSK